MATTTARMLDLLGVLQSRPEWSGTELAARFDVTPRTIRNDIARLRELGYPVATAHGPWGGYRLGPGGKMPPLLLDDDEAVAIAVGLRALGGVAGADEAGTRALAKLDQVLPSRLRSRVAALGIAVDRGLENTGSDADDPVADPQLLGQLAEAIGGSETVRFHYFERSLSVEPYRLVVWQRRWYLVARDPAADAWAPYRVDWIEPRPPTRRRFAPQPLAEADYATLVMREVAASGWAVHARVTVLAPAEAVRIRINPAVGVVEAVDDVSCILVTGADSVDTIAAYVGMLGFDFTVDGPPDLLAAIARLGARYRRAVRSG